MPTFTVTQANIGTFNSGGIGENPGDTVNFTGSFSSVIDPQRNGASGNPITLNFSGATLSNYINVASNSWITFFGGTYRSTPSNFTSSATGSSRSDALFEFNQQSSNNIVIDGFTFVGASGGTKVFIQLQYCSNCTIRNCHADNVAGAVVCDGSQTNNVLIQNNYFRNCITTAVQTDIVFMGDASFVTIKGNMLIQRSPGMNSDGTHNDIIQTYHGGSGSGASPFGWTICFNWLGLYMESGPRPAPSGDNSWTMTENFVNGSAGYGLKFYGNVFDSGDAFWSGNNGFGWLSDSTSTIMHVYNNTAIRRNGPDHTIGVNGGAVVHIKNNIFYADSDESGWIYTVVASSGSDWFANFFNNASNFDVGHTPTATEAGTNGSLTLDPQFVDLANKNYSLKPTSPCIGKGQTIAGAEYAFGIAPGSTWPNPTIIARTGAWDSGAFQSGGAPASPTVTASAATGLGTTTATLNGSISSNGGQTITADGFDWGLTTGYGNSASATVVQSGSFSANITGLTANTLYHFRSKATNATGQGVSGDLTFNTNAAVGPPTVSVGAASGIGSTTATLNGSISSNGGQTITADGFDWGLTTGYGNSASATVVQSGAFASNLVGLIASTTYHYRAKATNASGQSVSGDQSFTTPASGGLTTPTLIQHVAFGMERNPVPPAITFPYPNPVGVGNLLILGVQYAHTGDAGALTSITSVIDSSGNSWTLGKNFSTATNNAALYYFTASASAVLSVAVTITNLHNSPSRCQAVLSEFYNAGAVDGTPVSSATSKTAGSITTTAANSLVYEWGIDLSDTNANGGNFNGTSPITAGAGFTLLSADLQVGSCDQYKIQSVAGAVSCTFTTSGAATWGSIGIAFKASSSGTLPPAGIRIISAQHTLIDSEATQGRIPPTVMQFPCTGNLLVGLFNSADQVVTGVTDSLGNAWSVPAAAETLGDGGFVPAQIVYAANANTDPTLSGITIAVNSPVVGDSMMVLYDVAGASTSPFDKAAVATGRQLAIGNLDTVTNFSPSTANGLVFLVTSNYFGTTYDVPHGAGFISDAAWVTYITGQGTSTLDENNGYSHIYNTSTAPLTFTFVTNGGPIDHWGAAAIAFKAAPTDTTAPSAPSVPSLLALSSTQIRVTMSTAASDNIDGPTALTYHVERRVAAGAFSGIDYATFQGTVSPVIYTDNGCAPSTSYGYRVRAEDTSHNLGPYATSAANVTTPAGSGAPIAFVQVNSATPNSTGTITCPFTAAQSAGDLNVVIIGWDNASALTVTGVSDNVNGAYTVGVPTTINGTIQQAIYYRANILNAAPGVNVVTVTLSASATFPDLRILEYSGLATASPVDVTSTAPVSQGMTTTPSVSITTTNAKDVIVVGGTTSQFFSGTGASFTRRLSTPNSDIVDDDIVSATGTYSDPTGTGPSSSWVMQAIAFKGAPTGTIPLSTPASVILGSVLGLNGTVTLTNIQLNTPVTVSPGILSSPKSRINHRTLTAINSGAVGPVKTRNTHAEVVFVSSGSTSSIKSRDTHRAHAASKVVGSLIPWMTKNGTMAPSFIQSNSGTPSGVSTITVPYLLEQIIGDTNVVIVGWNNASALTITSVSDLVNGTYTLAVAINSIGAVQQAIYYFKNISGASPGSNSVKVVLSGIATQPDVRILEYSGIDRSTPIDVTGTAAGTSASPTVTMTSSLGSGVLEVTGGTTSTNFTGPGTGFTQRILTNMGNIADDSLLPVITVTPTQFGFATHFNQGWNPNVLMPLIAATGARWIRDDLSSTDWEPSQGNLRISPANKVWCDIAHANGLKVCGILGGNSTYTGGDFTDPTLSANRAAFIAQSGLVDAIEVENEPNNAYKNYKTGLGKNWLTELPILTSAVTNAVNAVSASVQVIGLGAQGSQIWGMYPSTTLNGVVYHPYDTGDSRAVFDIPDTCYEQPDGANSTSALFYIPWITICRSQTALPLWETEWGVQYPDRLGGSTPDQQCDYLVRRMLTSAGLGVEYNFIYEFKDNGSTDLFGVYDQAGTTAKASYAAVTNVIGALSNVQGTPSVKPTFSSIANGNATDAVAYAYQGVNKTVASFWFGNHSPSAPPASSTCTLQFTVASGYTIGTAVVLNPITGTSVPLSTYGASLAGSTLTVSGLPLSDHPLLITN